MPRAIRFEPRADRMLAIEASALLIEFQPPEAKGFSKELGNIAVVDVRGPLVQHSSPYCPWDSYDALEERARAAIADAPKALVLRIDSPGGDALGCFECARTIRKMCSEAGVELITYGDGMIASAAYALACAASAIFIPQAAEVGSIGVVKGRTDVTAMNAAHGLAMYFFASGARKLDGNPNVAMTKEEAVATQAKVDEYAALFFDFVAEMRPKLSAAEVKSVEASLLFGRAAVTAGLADGVVEWGELLAMVASGIRSTSGAAPEETEMNKKEMRAFLATLAESKDEETAKKAKAAIKCLDEEGGGESDEKKKDEEAKAKAEADEKEKKDADAKAKAEADEKDEAKAKASTDTAFKALAKVHELEAKLKDRDEADERAKLFATRPDFSAEVKATLETLPIERVREAVEKWPRVRATSQSTVNANVTGAGGIEREQKPAYIPRLTAEEERILARLDRGRGTPDRASMTGTRFTTPFINPAQANKVLADIEKESV